MANRSLFGKLASEIAATENRLTSADSNSQQAVNPKQAALKNDDWIDWVAPYTNDKLNDIHGTYDW